MSVGVPLRQLRGHVEIHGNSNIFFDLPVFFSGSVLSNLHGCYYILISFSRLVLKPFSLSSVVLFFSAIRLRAHEVILSGGFQFVRLLRLLSFSSL